MFRNLEAKYTETISLKLQKRNGAQLLHTDHLQMVIRQSFSMNLLLHWVKLQTYMIIL